MLFDRLNGEHWGRYHNGAAEGGLPLAYEKDVTEFINPFFLRLPPSAVSDLSGETKFVDIWILMSNQLINQSINLLVLQIMTFRQHRFHNAEATGLLCSLFSMNGHDEFNAHTDTDKTSLIIINYDYMEPYSCESK